MKSREPVAIKISLTQLARLLSSQTGQNIKPPAQGNQHECECENCNTYTPEKHWGYYNQKRRAGISSTFTDILLDSVPAVISDAFNQSTMPVIDLGVSTGEQHAALVKAGRTVIGYENSPTVISQLEQIGIIARNVDLNKQANKKLAYRDTLKKDLATPSHVMLVHILEYLSPEAATYLIYTLMKAAKPGSTFYIQAYTECVDNGNNVSFVTLNRYGYYASFFGARTDMQVLYHQPALMDQRKDVPLEHVVVKKLA